MTEPPFAGFDHRPGTQQVLPRRRFLIIRNCHAGVKSVHLVAGVAEALAARGAVTRIIETKNAEAVHEALHGATDIDAVIAAGGDGTVRALALTLNKMGLALPIGLIPAGTGNVLANEVGLARKPDKLAELLIGAPARQVQIMQANGMPFLLMASSGFDAEVLLRLSMRLKQQIARAAYTLPTLAALTQAVPAPFEVMLDGAQHWATWAIITNSRTYGGSFTLTKDVSIFDERLQAVLFSARTRMGRLKELLWLAGGHAERCASVSITTCRRAEILAPRHLPSQIDGDPLGFGPVTIGPGGRSLHLIVPADAR
ncbi:MAG TPA: diacylglycerol kinase family protein [Hyphomicrobiaceae bacterium]|nr:diacylglycerol kinase family protein [Hyphomicrobiaceae bacterium]